MNTEGIANFVVNTDYGQIEPEVIDAGKKAVLDFMGVTLAGSLEPAGKLIANYVREINGSPEAGVIGKGFKVPAQMAAIANGTMAHSLDYDDTSANSLGHPSAAILPAILALGEKLQSSGKDILEAYLLGFEVGSKLGLRVSKNARSAGWHNTGVIGSIGAAVSAAKLLRLSDLETRMALGISASMAGGLLRNFGTMTKPLHAGNAAGNGVFASLMAKQCFTAHDAILEGEQGFCKVFGGTAKSETTSTSEVLGKPWDIMTPGISFKPYPCCRGIHTLIDAALALRDKYHFKPGDIAAVECILSPVQSGTMVYQNPKTGLEGKFSIEYGVSLALLEGQVLLKHFTDEKVSEPGVQHLLPRIKRIFRGEWGKPGYTESVVVRTRDGREYSHTLAFDMAKGQPKNPLSFEELCEKYRDCAGLVLKSRDVDRTLDLLSQFEGIEDISALMKIATFGTTK